MAFDSDSPNENRNKAPKTLDDLHGIAQGPGCSELIKVSEFIDSFSANHLATGAAFVYLRETTVRTVLLISSTYCTQLAKVIILVVP